MRVIRVIGGAVLGLAVSAGTLFAEERAVVIGGGEPSGLYLPEAAAVCRVLEKDKDRHGLSCLIQTTAGSRANLSLLRDGRIKLALVQSRLALDAAAGLGSYANGPAFPELRALMSLHGEPLLLLSGPDSKISVASDLKGKRIAYGRSGGFQRMMADALLAAEGLKPSDFAAVVELDPLQAAKALCANQIDAAFFAGLHPMTEAEEALDGCGATPVTLQDAAIDAYLKANPAFAKMSIPGNSYQGVEDGIASFGPRALLVASTALSEADAYEVVKAVFDNVAAFKAMHPILNGIDRKQMARETAGLPLHDGAKRYFRDARLSVPDTAPPK